MMSSEKVCVLQGGASPCKSGVVRAIRSGTCYAFLFLTLNLFNQTAFALQAGQAKHIPHVDQEATWNFQKYIHASASKAYAISPGGAWAWSESESSDDKAKQVALESCREQTQQKCIIYALNNKIVFDKKKWSTLWRLNKFEKDNASAFGVSRTAHFPDLVYKDAKGKTYKLSDSKGKIRLVHFWGSWCPPCIREMPELVKLQSSFKKDFGNKVEMILLQVREPFSESMLWAKKYQFDKLPLYNSAPSGENNDILTTSSGKTLYDRTIARVFPSSYVLDQKGRVLFVNHGPIHNWDEYLPLFKGVVK